MTHNNNNNSSSSSSSIMLVVWDHIINNFITTGYMCFQQVHAYSGHGRNKLLYSISIMFRSMLDPLVFARHLDLYTMCPPFGRLSPSLPSDVSCIHISI